MIEGVFYRWQVIAEGGKPKRQPRLLKWEMTEEDAEKFQKSNPGTVLEKIPGSGQRRNDYDGRHSPPK